jgi:NADPH-dependent 2,4-dienoyl-CoA reductase/sulfur reductase-like enzyme
MSGAALPRSTPLLIVGAGPAGLAAALAASGHGQAVTLIDDNALPGGQIWRGGPGRWRDRRADALWRCLNARANVRIVGGARVMAASGPRELLLEVGAGAHQIDWQRLIICSGARELLLPFPGWTLPGVTGAGGMQALLKGGMPIAGKRVVVAGSGPLLLAVAQTVLRHGGDLRVIAEQRGTRELATFFGRLALSHRAKLVQALELFVSLRGARYRHGATVLAAHGDERLRGVTLEQAGRSYELECDFLACGFGLVPNTELATLLGCALDAGRVRVDHLQRASRDDVFAAGESTGIGGVDKALAEGRIAGLAAVGRVPTPADRAARTRAQRFATLLAHSFAPSPALRALCQPETLVCRCEDVTAAQLAPYGDWRSAKLQTRLGMGPCQGRICGSACQVLYGWDAPGLRQPIFPTLVSTLASPRAGQGASDDPA